MIGGLGNLVNIMKQAGQLKENMAKMQEELANMEVTGQSGAGLVSDVMTGRHDVRRVNLDDSLMQEDKEVLEALIAAAVNDAVRKLEQAIAGATQATVELVVEVNAPTQETPAVAAARRKAARQKAAELSIQSDPMVQRLCAEFSAEICADTIRPIDEPAS